MALGSTVVFAAPDIFSTNLTALRWPFRCFNKFDVEFYDVDNDLFPPHNAQLTIIFLPLTEMQSNDYISSY